MKQLNEMKDPKINEKSEQLISKKTDYNKMKVEDRLLKMGKMWKDKKD